ncbi:hypothetical protein PR048_005624 [Dryococelus australis]|uniref:Uncharacterized protein n=1 Tax=Dryococelus australis TaxID=614101 RepID=A0ABQ9I8S0_9NEOP|nr:hypothetical protein PR048_005624 [Dryococelus australis]
MNLKNQGSSNLHTGYCQPRSECSDNNIPKFKKFGFTDNAKHKNPLDWWRDRRAYICTCMNLCIGGCILFQHLCNVKEFFLQLDKRLQKEEIACHL